MLLDDADIGTALCIATLILSLVPDNPHQWPGLSDRAIYRLKRLVVEEEYDSTYVYYKTPCPWLQIKLLQLISASELTEESNARQSLTDALEHIIDTYESSSKNVQESNARNAVLFEAINLLIQTRCNISLLNRVLGLLGSFISIRETNLRYLGLETMAQLASSSQDMDPLRKHQQLVLQSLKDRDISVRRRALDLLYSMCDMNNAKQIVDELIHYLHSSDYAIRAEMVLKIAILVEKFAKDHAWYMEVILQLLAVAGDHVSDEIWHRIIQVVTNNEKLQEHAARSVLKHLTAPVCHGNLVKVGGFILGEFGHLIANETSCSPLEQFLACHAKFNSSQSETRTLLLNTYIKFINVFPEIRRDVLLVFEELQLNMEPEIQQRACEYLALASLANEDLLQIVCEEMPPLAARPSALIRKGNMDLLEREASSPQTDQMQQMSIVDTMHCTPGWEPGYRRLLWRNDGLLYEDAQLQVGLRSEFHGSRGRLILYYGNKSSSDYTSFSVSSHVDGSALLIHCAELPPTIVPAKSQVQQIFDLSCIESSIGTPKIRVSYLAGASQELILRLPVTLHKFMEPSSITEVEYQTAWESYQAEASLQLSITIPGNRFTPARTKSILTGYRWACLTASNSTTAAGELHLGSAKPALSLLRVDHMSDSDRLQVVIRGQNQASVDAMAQALSAGPLQDGVP